MARILLLFVVAFLGILGLFLAYSRLRKLPSKIKFKITVSVLIAAALTALVYYLEFYL